MRPALHRSVSILCLVVVVCGMNIAVWAWAHQSSHPPRISGQFAGLDYSLGKEALKGDSPTQPHIDRDLAFLAQHTKHIRIYSSLNAVPTIKHAKKLGLDVLVGAWLDKRVDNNEQEIDSLIDLSRNNTNVTHVLVGDEVLMNNFMSTAELVAYIDRVRAHVHVPVSTAEAAYIWLKYPELADHVDFITVHLLPYWNGKHFRDAVPTVFANYDEVRARFPHKRIVIGEVGWPSEGERMGYAEPSLSNEADFVRRFVYEADKKKLDYYLMESVDQPWKRTVEGGVGAYWGVFDNQQRPKFPLTGPTNSDYHWLFKAAVSSLVTLIPLFMFNWYFFAFRLWGRLLYAALIQAAVAETVWSLTLPFNYYLSYLDWLLLIPLLLAQCVVVLVLLIQGFEFTETLSASSWRRKFMHKPLSADDAPWVSIHVASCNEPPDMVIQTLNSIALLDYPRFEVIVVDNNTKDPALWQPLQARCAALGEHFRFFHLESWPGFKAGALNFALEQVNPDTAVVAIVDSDYVVDRTWLRELIGHFDDAKVGIVQAPQAHREYELDAFRRMCNWEYEAFFRIGMHHRNERDAIIQHGTMTMIRHSVLRELRWAEWCICEDAELGLRILQAGYSSVYVDEVFGRGLTPANFSAYKAQRFRWASGAMQILRANLKDLLFDKRLKRGQRFHFLTGWTPWFADTLHLTFSLMSLFWTAGMLIFPSAFSLPYVFLMIPVIGFFFSKNLFSVILYRTRVKCSWRDSRSAAIASMALSHSIARGIFHGWLSRTHTFVRTTKVGKKIARRGRFSEAHDELFMFLCLLLAVTAMLSFSPFLNFELMVWCATLLLQSVPYVAAMYCSWIATRRADGRATGADMRGFSKTLGRLPRARMRGQQGATPSLAHLRWDIDA